jgi:hypothetical protein
MVFSIKVSLVKSNIYDFTNDTFIENTIPGQFHLWRIQASYEKQSQATNISVRLRNTLSGFITVSAQVVAAGTTTGEVNFVLFSIADSVSLPSPFGTGQGYVLEVMADDNTFENSVARFLQIESVVRVSHSYTPR